MRSTEARVSTLALRYVSSGATCLLSVVNVVASALVVEVERAVSAHR